MRGSAVALSVLVLVPCASAEARALVPLDVDFEVEVGAKVGAGTSPMGAGFPNPLGFGAGGRAGVSIFGFYGGVSAIYYFGGHGPFGTAAPAGSPIIEGGSVSAYSLLSGIELGYGLKLLHILVLRPQIGWGIDSLGASGGAYLCNKDANIICSHSVRGTIQYQYLEPGLTVLFEIGKVYAGIDVNALLLPSGPEIPPPTLTAPAFSPYSSPFTTEHRLEGAVTVHAQVGVRF